MRPSGSSRTVESQSPPWYFARYAVKTNSRLFSGLLIAAVPPFAQPEVKLAIRLAMSLLRPVPVVGTFGATGALSTSDFIAGIVEACELMLKLDVVRFVVVTA